MIDPDLLARAVKAGLRLIQCSFCAGGGALRSELMDGYFHLSMEHEPDGRLVTACVCDGTGEDRTPGGVLMAICLHGETLVDVGYGQADVTLPPNHKHNVTDHDRTPTGIATAALTAFCRAREATPCL